MYWQSAVYLLLLHIVILLLFSLLSGFVGGIVGNPADMVNVR